MLALEQLLFHKKVYLHLLNGSNRVALTSVRKQTHYTEYIKLLSF